MTDYLRRIVSGGKARFKDDALNLDLDLVYVTDNIIIMGYPASGLEGLYRNRREDAKRFLDHRHPKKYWVFNFCPLKENSYDNVFFDGRVSRYPFPDHHVPPLAYLPLVAREMRAWLDGDQERVAVLHCKAGKGRSGTMACTYLLTLGDQPSAPQLERSYTPKQWAKRRADNTIGVLPEEGRPSSSSLKHTLPSPKEPDISESDTVGIIDSVGEPAAHPSTTPPPSNPKNSFTHTLKGVLDLHTARRMKSPPPTSELEKKKKVKQGVSIPSQRRWLYYWALLLAGEAPKDVWPINSTKRLDPDSDPDSEKPRPRVRLTQINVRMRETSSVKLGLVKGASLIIGRAGLGKAPGPTQETTTITQVWASLARYDDSLVGLLEKWEVWTRSESGGLGDRRRPGSERMPKDGDNADVDDVEKVFEGGRWDREKMVRSFARFGEDKLKAKAKDKDKDKDKDDTLITYTLTKLTEERWEGVKAELQHESGGDSDPKDIIEMERISISRSDIVSTHEHYPTISGSGSGAVTPNEGVVLDAAREVRVKLHMGQVFMGWLWFIPTFHMPPPPPSPETSSPPSKTKFVLTRKELDFPVGLGSGIVDVEIEMEWIPGPPSSSESIAVDVEPPTPLSERGLDAVQAVLGGEGVREAVDVRQGLED
ncbi:uncharacterized protein LACBIDRAFT_310144 [Laccaria bicolor S238N-H82]|uniref:phosphatidylinositol-3,4,5-trisphosphate 3-phosphatase n=1 Tax=Laccaria bicolor (strain S238N-H82 / ATCC MYA-4686) TaxID=486041 RepID=B0DTX6_LACBS|nr:uncharacterized protein LACBIDRAFT_310144 [Laccaria bicolor S238N-H82]EDR01925.1 predicted protein [Laccaria bicolor S238N-H82]|eukprot:XP_001887316.1 predicted protein [Laccaria bicolor S238N-H82]